MGTMMTEEKKPTTGSDVSTGSDVFTGRDVSTGRDTVGRDIIGRDAIMVSVDSNLSTMIELLVTQAAQLGGIQTTLSILVNDLTALRTIVGTHDVRITKHDAQIAQLETAAKRRGRLDIG